MAVSAQDIQATVEGRTVPGTFLATVAAKGDAPALRWREGDDAWGTWTYRQYADLVARAATGLAALGVGPGQRVLLMMRNRPEFHVVDVAATFCGATPVSVYNSSSADQVAYLARHSGATVAVVEDAELLGRFQEVRGELPDLAHLVVVDPAAAAAGTTTWDELVAAEPADLEAGAAACKPDDLATLIYTSGTTGPPKGVMLTHDNIAWTAECIRLALPFDDYEGKRVVSYLPMAHIAERMVSHYIATLLGFEVTTCPEFAQVADYFRGTRPHVVFGVPRVWEKVHAGVRAALAADPAKEKAFGEAIEAALPIAEAMDWGTATDEQRATWDFLDQVAFSTMRDLVGLDQVLLAVSGAAPLPADVLRWFRAAGVPLSEIYGMSESTGPISWAPTRVKPGAVGPPVPGCEVVLGQDGEVLFRGGNVFVGYLGAPELTAETIDEAGWVHTGDIGTIDDDGYLRIVDRKKELLITAGGKNISPANLEIALKAIPIVGQACAIGDDRPYIAALVTLDPEVAPAWARQHGIAFDSLTDLATTPEVVAEVDRGLAEVMEGFNHAEQVKRVKVLGEEWLPDSDVLTPTSKLKRRGIAQRYAAEIDALYA